MVRLDAALLPQSGDVAALKEHGITEIAADIPRSGLVRIDLTGNLLTSAEGLAQFQSLKWLSLAGNKLSSTKGLQGLKKLTVLNCSKNEITSTDDIRKLRELRALILNDNKISSPNNFEELTNLDTLVLSQNPIHKLGASLSKMTLLKKLSLSHCEIKDLGTSLMNCIALEELRLAHNKLKKLPKELELNSQLKIIDVGNNKVKTWKSVEVLQQLQRLKNLNLRGNPLSDDRSNYAENVRNKLPALEIFDGRPTGKNRKHKRKSKQDEDKSEPPSLQKHKKIKSNEESKGDGDEEKPFFEMIASSNKAAKATPLLSKNMNERAEEDPNNKTGKGSKNKSGKREDSRNKPEESKVVSITEGEKGKHRKRPKPSSTSLAHALETAEIGAGGPSSWDS